MKGTTTKRLLDNLQEMLARGRRLHKQNLAVIAINTGMMFINIINLWSVDWDWTYGLLIAMHCSCVAVMLYIDRKLRKSTHAVQTLHECVESLDNLGDRAHTPEGHPYALFLIEQAEAAYHMLTGEVLFKDGWQEEMNRE